MTNNQLGLRFIGIKPEDVRAGELAILLSSFEDLIWTEVQKNRPFLKKEDLGIGLVRLERESIGLGFITQLPEVTIPAYEAVTKAVYFEDFLNLSSTTLEHLKKIHSFIKRRDIEGEFLIRNGSDSVVAIMVPNMVIPEHPKIVVQTTVYGRVLRVGGAEPRVMIEKANGENSFYEIANEELARELGQRLYQWAGMKGRAILDSDSLDILDFKVESLNDFIGDASNATSMRELSDHTRKYFADLDEQGVDYYVSQIRDGKWKP